MGAREREGEGNAERRREAREKCNRMHFVSPRTATRSSVRCVCCVFSLRLRPTIHSPPAPRNCDYVIVRICSEVVCASAKRKRNEKLRRRSDEMLCVRACVRACVRMDTASPTAPRLVTRVVQRWLETDGRLRRSKPKSQSKNDRRASKSACLME